MPTDKNKPAKSGSGAKPGQKNADRQQQQGESGDNRNQRDQQQR